MAAASGSPPMTIRSERIPDPGRLQDLLPEAQAFAWLRAGDGLVGWGQAARLDLTGPDRFVEADRWWRRVVADARIVDEVGVPGSGPLGFTSFAFDDGPTSSTIVLPRVVIGRRGDVAWRTTVGAAPDDVPVVPRQPPSSVQVSEEAADVARWRDAVAQAIAAIRAGRLAKVVLALPLEVRTGEAVDGRELLVRLLRRYPDCWGYLFDGFLGATPELLVERTGRRVRSRVLAGTLPRGAPGTDCVPPNGNGSPSIGSALLGSAKDLSEHRLAAEPVARTLRGRLDTLQVPDGPSVLELANVAHLSTELSGLLRDPETSVLELAAALHPTPAVAGVPTAQALRMIGELESRDRGRYAGPVGWIDGSGDGELCLALRCATVQGALVRLYAGCGIVADSDPESEVAEWRAKLRPVLDALCE
jgi:menaquinone-specific isochorismate synthase